MQRRLFILAVLLITSICIAAQEVGRRDVQIPSRTKTVIASEKPDSCPTVWNVHGDGAVVPLPPPVKITDFQMSVDGWPKFKGTIRLLNPNSDDLELPWCEHDSVEQFRINREYSYSSGTLSLWTEQQGRIKNVLVAGGSLFVPASRSDCRIILRRGEWVTLNFKGEATCASDGKTCPAFEDAFQTRFVARWDEASYEREFKDCTDRTSYFKSREASSEAVALKMQ